MTLLAYLPGQIEPVESFSVPAEQWTQWRKLPVGSFHVQAGNVRVPAVLKRSPRGLQFFACAPGYGGTTAPKSIEHQMAQIELVRGLREAGFKASVERPGSSPTGEAWQADVFLEGPGYLMAIEVQLSQQHWDDYRARTDRYTRSGVCCVWLIRKAHIQAFENSRYRYLVAQGVHKDKALNQGLPDMAYVVLDLNEDKELTEGTMQAVARTSNPRENPLVRQSLGSFAAGLASGFFRFSMTHTGEERWIWVPPARSA